MREDRTKDQMTGRVNVRQSARPIMRFILRKFVRIRGVIHVYTACFQRSSVDKVECKRGYRPRILMTKYDKSNSQKQDQLWPKTDMLLQCKPYWRNICPRFLQLFIHFALYVSKQNGTWRIPMSHITYRKVVGTNSGRGKNVEAKTSQGKYDPVPSIY